MTVVPLPDIPCVRVSMSSALDAVSQGGSRFYLSYAGTAPTASNCATLASDVAAAWSTNLASVINDEDGLQLVDVLDIASNSGQSGLWTGNEGGSRSGTPLPDSCATQVNFSIARRYRGGKPRIFLFPGVTSDLENQSTYSTAFTSAVDTAVAAFFSELAGLSIGAMGALAHVSLSYYQSFKNLPNSSGRERAVPQYRPVALHDPITGYVTKARIGSQRRRRSATTP